MKIDHTEMVAALVKPGADILSTLTPGSVDLWHAATGVAGECTETLEAYLLAVETGDDLDVINLIEELGDIEFYMAQMRMALGLSRTMIMNSHPGFTGAKSRTICFTRLAVMGGLLLDQIKKVTVYNKPADEIILAYTIGAVEHALDDVRIFANITREETLAENIAKLGERYKGFVYTDKEAQARADKV